MSDFATHQDRLANDNAYRARLGLGPVLPARAVEALDAASAAVTRNDDVAASIEALMADPLVTAANTAIEAAQALLVESATATVGPASDGVDPALFARVDRLNELRKELDRLAKALGVEAAEGQAALVDMYVHAGTGLQEYGGRVGTLGSQIWARKVDDTVTSEDIAAALHADGLSHLVSPESYNSSRLSGYLRDLDEAGKPIPTHLSEVIEANEVWRVGFTTRRATRAQRRMNGAASSVVDGASQD